MALHGPVLAVIDLDDEKDVALGEGAALAKALRAPLVAGHVLPEAYRIRMLFPQFAGVEPAEQRGIEERAAKALVARVTERLGAAGKDVRIEIAAGSPHAGVLEIAEHVRPHVIVVGPGSTAGRVARGAPCPVLVARPGAAKGGVLGATDLSDPSLPAVRMAVSEAKRRGVPLRLVHCVNLGATVAPATGGGLVPMVPLPAPVVAEIENFARERLQTVLKAADGTGEIIVSPHPPITGILQTADAEPTSLIVLATHGRTGLTRLALGSVAEAVMDRASCSVLVVPLAG
jgi:nucleotide-binding universal stress UspA family protein